MRTGLIGLILAFLWAGLAPARRSKGGGATTVHASEARAAPWERAVAAGLVPGEVALSHSLWADSVGAMCRVPARYGALLVAVRFGDLMRMSLDAMREAPQLVEFPVAAAGAGWTGRARLSAAHDADIASRYVSIARGSTPVVRLIKTGAIRPRRAVMGMEIAQAA